MVKMVGFQPVHVAIFLRFSVVRARFEVLCWTEFFTLSVDSAAGASVLLLYATLVGFLEPGLELAGFLRLGTRLPEGRHFVVVGDGGNFGRFGVQIEHASVVAGRPRLGPGPGAATGRTGCGRGSGYRNGFIVHRVAVFADVVGPHLVACCISLENGHQSTMQCNKDILSDQRVESTRVFV